MVKTFNFKSAYINRPEYEGEVNDGKKLVEVIGFVSAKTRIENIILAGKRLQAIRRDDFDFPDGEDDGGDFDPARNPGTDPVDAQAALDRLKASIAAKQAKSTADKKNKQAESTNTTATNVHQNSSEETTDETSK